MDTLSRLLSILKVDPTGIAERARRMPIEVPDISREDLGSIFAELGIRKVAEIGVEQGAFSESLARGNPNGHLFCIDGWVPYRGYRDHVGTQKLEDFYQLTKQRMAKYNATVIRKFSTDAATDFKDLSLDAVYIDANHDLPHFIEDLAMWTPKVRKGGIISGHDYQKRVNSQRVFYQCHVVEGLTAWTESFDIAPWFVLGRKELISGEKRDRPRSWMYVKD